MREREARELVEKYAAPRETSDILKSTALFGLGGAGIGAGVGALGSVLSGSESENDLELARLKRRRRMMSGILGGAAIGGLAGTGVGLADTVGTDVVPSVQSDDGPGLFSNSTNNSLMIGGAATAGGSLGLDKLWDMLRGRHEKGVHLRSDAGMQAAKTRAANALACALSTRPNASPDDIKSITSRLEAAANREIQEFEANKANATLRRATSAFNRAPFLRWGIPIIGGAAALYGGAKAYYDANKSAETKQDLSIFKTAAIKKKVETEKDAFFRPLARGISNLITPGMIDAVKNVGTRLPWLKTPFESTADRLARAQLRFKNFGEGGYFSSKFGPGTKREWKDVGESLKDHWGRNWGGYLGLPFLSTMGIGTGIKPDEWYDSAPTKPLAKTEKSEYQPIPIPFPGTVFKP